MTFFLYFAELHTNNRAGAYACYRSIWNAPSVSESALKGEEMHGRLASMSEPRFASSRSMITRIRIQNYRSFVDAEAGLRPFSLVVGANGSGKSNLLRFLSTVSSKSREHHHAGQIEFTLPEAQWTKHKNHQDNTIGFEFGLANNQSFQGFWSRSQPCPALSKPLPWQGQPLPVFNIDPSMVSATETAVPSASVQSNGSGTVQVLDALKNGDREDLFDRIEENFRRYVPEVQKLSLRTVDKGKKQIQVREVGLQGDPLPATELSEGTRLILCILTILHQENPPAVILLEDIDRGLHPRLFEFVAPLMKDIAERSGVNILATTHNPYLVDCFQDDKESVIIVEKKDGVSTLSTLADRLKDLDYDKVDPEDMPLGNLWFTGLVGGVPPKLTRRPKP